MPRSDRSGRFVVRIPPRLHDELAKEAFERRVSINQICLEALVTHRQLRRDESWKAGQVQRGRVRSDGYGRLERDIASALERLKK
jgi:hypothetical protein